jgi:acyl-CoA thioesterase YciA
MELITTKTVLALDIGVNNNLFGGIMLSELDKAGAAYASQICDSQRMVTKKFEEVIFEKPVKINNLIKIYGEVVKFGNTSVTIKLEARKHNVETGKQQLVCSTVVVFVKINDDGEPVPISDRVKKRFQERYKKYHKGLLTPEELEAELSLKS